MAEVNKTAIEGCLLIQVKSRFQDIRGFFSKPLHLNFLHSNGMPFECRESFVSYSHPNVLRGMHYQAHPHAHDKLISCLSGRVFDVVVDLRRNSKTYGVCATFNLKAENNEALFIPVGCAHGFQVMGDEGAWMVYYTSKEYDPESDRGVLWSSLNIQWPVQDPILSARDQGFPAFHEVKDFS